VSLSPLSKQGSIVRRMTLKGHTTIVLQCIELGGGGASPTPKVLNEDNPMLSLLADYFRNEIARILSQVSPG
jgi:hypothetical protein